MRMLAGDVQRVGRRLASGASKLTLGFSCEVFQSHAACFAKVLVDCATDTVANNAMKILKIKGNNQLHHCHLYPKSPSLCFFLIYVHRRGLSAAA